jgi:hypothetical protein
VLKRFALRSLVLAGLLLACFAHLIWNGWHATEIVGENIPYPRLSSGYRDIDLWHPSASFGRVYDLIFLRAGPGVKPVPPGAHLKVQLASNGRTRLLVVRTGHPNTDVSWLDILLRRERLQVVADREWIDLGPLPEGEERLDYQITGLLPGPFGFAEPYQPQRDHFSGFRMRRPESPLPKLTRDIIRYRFASAAPVAASETLARFFFFISCSRVLQVTGVLALALLFVGWFWLFEKRYARAVACLVPALTFLHACCLAPFQGADEATHVGTVEALLWNPAMIPRQFVYPSSLRRAYEALDYEAWVRYPDIPIPLAGPDRRRQLREGLDRTLADQAITADTFIYDAFLVNPLTRAPLYYNSFRLAAPILRRVSVLDRLEAYVVLSAAASLAFFLAGLLVLTRSGLDEDLSLPYGLVALVPYSVGVVASCSNYSPAIGIGAFLAACALAAILARDGPIRRRAMLAFGLVSTVGIAVWDDFVFLATPSLLLLAGFGIRRALRQSSGRAHPKLTEGFTAAGVLLTGLFLFALATGRLRPLFTNLGARIPKQLGGSEDPTLWILLATAAVPFVVALVLVLFLIRGRTLPEAERRRFAVGRVLATAAVFFILFFLTSYHVVPFESTHLDLADLVAAHWSSFWSNNFSWDQDPLFWKMYWGVFGYADVAYPDAFYAVARWLNVALFLSLPVLAFRFTTKKPNQSALLLVVSGFALSVCIVTNSIRHLQPSLPWGRFILPLLPLAALPALARTEAPERDRWWRAVTFAAVALHVWTALTLLGSRYAVGL